MRSPSLFFISIRFCRPLNNFGPLNDHIITEIWWVVTMAPAVPSADILRWPVTSQWPSSKRLLLRRIFYIRAHKIIPRALSYKSVPKRTQFAYPGSFWPQFRVSLDLFTDHTAEETTVRTFLPRLLTVASRIQNCTYDCTKTNYVPNLSVELAHFHSITDLKVTETHYRPVP